MRCSTRPACLSSLGYTFQDDAGSTQELTITPATLTLSGLTAADKVYDGNTLATLTSFGTLSGALDGDVLSLNTESAKGRFQDAEIGSGKPVTVTDLGLSGVDAGNYMLASPSTTRISRHRQRFRAVTAIRS